VNQEEREALMQETTQRILACLHQTTNAEEMIRSMLTSYGVTMFAVGGRNTEEWIGRIVASLPIPCSSRALPPKAREERNPS
jgi:hypothetical protein